jgi:tetratricopeptide (TPR) repeat protein
MVRTYCGEGWEIQTFGAPSSGAEMVQQANAENALGMEAIVRQYACLVPDLAEAKNEELEKIRDLIGQGRSEEALPRIVSLRDSRSWAILPDDVKSKALRIHASLLIGVRNDLTGARELLSEAKSVCPSANFRVLEALLVFEEGDAETALQIVAQPRTVEEWNLQLRLLLGGGRIDDVRSSLASPPQGVVANADIAWVQGLLHLADRRLDEARADIASALKSKPLQFDLRVAMAMIDYANALSLAFPAWGHLVWPIPPPWNYVKRDPVSVGALREAGRVFEELIKVSPVAGRMELQTWRLACLANDLEKQEVAGAYVRQLIAESPGHYPAVMWALERGYDFDAEGPIAALRSRVDTADVNIDETVALCGLLVSKKQFEPALEILDTQHERWVAQGVEHLWALHKVQLLCLHGNTNAALILADEEKDESRRRVLKTLILEATTKESGDPRPLAQHWEEWYNETSAPNILLACCRAKRQCEDWKYLAAHARALVQQIATEAALRLALDGCFQAGEYELCLELLNENRSLLADGRLTSDLKRVEIECHHRLGRLPIAVQQAEKLLEEQPDFQTTAYLFGLQIETGDLQASALTARKFPGLKDVPPEYLLGIIPLVRPKDPQLAVELWQQVQARAGSDPKLASATAFQSFTLGIEDQAKGLFDVAMQAVGRPDAPLKPMSIAETIAFMTEHRQGRAELLKVYRRGEAPIHLVAARLEYPLVRLFFELVGANQLIPVPLSTDPIYARHGTRSQERSVKWKSTEREVFMDITSLLLAESVGLLDVVERYFSIIHVSGHLTTSLARQLASLQPVQPTRLQDVRRVLDLLEAKKIATTTFDDRQFAPLSDFATTMGTTWCGLLGKAIQEHGLLVDFWPLHTRDAAMKPVELPSGIPESIASPADIIESLVRAGIISSDAKPRMINSLGDCGARSGRLPDLRPGMTVSLDVGIAVLLAGCDALAVLCDRCRVVITAEESDSLRAEQRNVEQQNILSARTEGLMARIKRGFESGKYHPHYDERVHKAVRDPQQLPTDGEILCDALGFGERATAPVWCDDRFLNRHDSIGQSPIIDTFDVLRWLRSADAISEECYFEKLLQLRKANYRYLPVLKEEILRYLRQAPVVEGTLEETPPLAVLRRYFAACVMDREGLQMPVIDEHGNHHPREMIFVLTFRSVVDDVLAELWKDESEPDGVPEARADWVWENLWFDWPGPAEALGLTLNTSQFVQMAGASIGHLLALGIGLRSPLDAGSSALPSPRRRFLAWVESRILFPRLLNSPELMDSVVEVLSGALKTCKEALSTKKGLLDERTAGVMAYRASVGQFVCDLPRALKDRLKLSAQDLEMWCLRAGFPAVEFMGQQFPAEGFWSAAARAVNKGRATLLGIESNTKLDFGRSAEKYVLEARLRHGSEDRKGLFRNPCLRLMDCSVAVRNKLLVRHPAWFDFDEERRLAMIERIANNESPLERVQTLREIQEQSAAWYYDDLLVRLSNRESIVISEMLPKSVVALTDHLRISNPDGSTDDWPVAVESLLRDQGLEETIVRLSCLPARLPSVVMDSLRMLATEAVLKLLKGLESRLVSPVQRIHLIGLFLETRAVSTDHLPRAQDQLRAFLEPVVSEKNAEAFLAVLRWTHYRLGWLPETRRWHPSVYLRIVWLHASRVYQAFYSAGANPDSVHDWFQKNSRELTADMLSRNSALTRDAAYPLNISFLALVLKGLASEVGSLPEEVLAGIGVKAMLVNAIEGSRVKSRLTRFFCQDVTLCLNSLGSFLGETLEVPLQRILGTDVYEKYVPLKPELGARAALDLLTQSPDELAAWTALDLIADGVPIYPSMEKDLRDAIVHIDWDRVPPADFGQAATLCLLASRLALAPGDIRLCEHLQKQVFRVAELVAAARKKRGTPLVADRDYVLIGSLLVDATLTLCRTTDDPAATVQLYTSATASLISRWPELASVIRISLPSLLWMLPLHLQRSVWPLCFTLRATY